MMMRRDTLHKRQKRQENTTMKSNIDHQQAVELLRKRQHQN
jgi:hypothetical protein